MSDNAFRTAYFPGYTTAQLKEKLNGVGMLMETVILMEYEIDRREKVAAGDVSVMTPGERLRHARKESGR